MSGIITPSGLVNELTTIIDGDTISEVNVPGEVFNRKIKKSVDRTYMQGTLPAEVAGIKAGTEQLNPRSFISGRFDSEELMSGTLSVSGWYTIAELSEEALEHALGDFKVVCRGSVRVGSLSFIAEIINSGITKNQSNTQIVYTGKTNYNTPLANQGVLFARIAKSDSVQTAGAKVQVYLDVSTTVIISVQKTNNFARVALAGWELVTPYLDNTPTLPDGVTVGTFLEAGEELSFDVGVTYFPPDFTARRNSNDTLRCVVLWSEIPKQGTGLTITLPAISFTAIDGAGNTAVISGSHTISNFIINNKRVLFHINETGAFLGLNVSMLGIQIAGSGCKLTIT